MPTYTYQQRYTKNALHIRRYYFLQTVYQFKTCTFVSSKLSLRECNAPLIPPDFRTRLRTSPRAPCPVVLTTRAALYEHFTCASNLTNSKFECHADYSRDHKRFPRELYERTIREYMRVTYTTCTARKKREHHPRIISGRRISSGVRKNAGMHESRSRCSLGLLIKG